MATKTIPIITTFYPENYRTVIDYDSTSTINEAVKMLEEHHNCCVEHIIRKGKILFTHGLRRVDALETYSHKTFEELEFLPENDYIYVIRDQERESKKKYGSTTARTPFSSFTSSLFPVDTGFGSHSSSGGSVAGASMSAIAPTFSQTQMIHNFVNSFGGGGFTMNTGGGGGGSGGGGSGGGGGGGSGGSGGGGGGGTSPSFDSISDSLGPSAIPTTMIAPASSNDSFQYTEQLREIVNMGFLDVDRIRDFLNITGGNVEQAVGLLLG